jgi:cytochrome c-type biogenesis protein CcsB
MNAVVSSPKRFSFLVVFFLLLNSYFLLLSPSQAFSASATEVLAQTPVQHNGRVKPFESFAREAALLILGQDKFEGLSSNELVWRWIVEPEKWVSKPIIPVTLQELRDEFGLMIIKKRVSPQIVLNHEEFVNRAQAAMTKRQKKDRLSPVDRKRIEIYEHAILFQDIAQGHTPGWIAHPDDPRAGWLSLKTLGSEEALLSLVKYFPEEKVKALKNASQQLFLALQADSRSEAARQAAQELVSARNKLFESRGIVLDGKLLSKEIQYNKLHPFNWAWRFYLIGSLLFIAFMTFLPRRQIYWLAANVFIAGFLIHAYGFYLRCMIAGRPPVTNMYESIIWVSLAVVFFSLIIGFAYRTLIVPAIAGLVATLALMIAQSFPVVLDPTISPLVPVLRSNYWLTIHVLTITMSYGAFALAWGLGHVVVFNYAIAPEKKEKNQMVAQYVYRAVQIGVILLATGTVLGGVWANYSWGRFWGWDPKETWALIALLGYLVVLHGRFSGWMDTFGLAYGSVVAFLGVLMAWYGVNYVLAAGLHSYGFGGGGLPYVAAVVALDLTIVSIVALKYKAKEAKLIKSSI